MNLESNYISPLFEGAKETVTSLVKDGWLYRHCNKQR